MRTCPLLQEERGRYITIWTKSKPGWSLALQQPGILSGLFKHKGQYSHWSKCGLGNKNNPTIQLFLHLRTWWLFTVYSSFKVIHPISFAIIFRSKINNMWAVTQSIMPIISIYNWRVPGWEDVTKRKFQLRLYSATHVLFNRGQAAIFLSFSPYRFGPNSLRITQCRIFLF